MKKTLAEIKEMSEKELNAGLDLLAPLFGVRHHIDNGPWTSSLYSCILFERRMSVADYTIFSGALTYLSSRPYSAGPLERAQALYFTLQ